MVQSVEKTLKYWETFYAVHQQRDTDTFKMLKRVYSGEENSEDMVN